MCSWKINNVPENYTYGVENTEANRDASDLKTNPGPFYWGGAVPFIAIRKLS